MRHDDNKRKPANRIDVRRILREESSPVQQASAMDSFAAGESFEESRSYKTIADYERAFRKEQELKAADLRKMIKLMEAYEVDLQPPNLKVLQGFRKELEKINTSGPPNLIERRINDLEDFIRENGTNANVQTALSGYKAGDPTFIDRSEILIMANGVIIGRTKDLEGMDDEEFDRLVAQAGPHPLWFEDPLISEEDLRWC
ncbi:hypothetical protein FN846DRAFT_979056 [Sphaerosporella brunnea]|uniref:Uncharacterized protein n=1 Tax=Sphaerosporella brunnea TaxID=1250544 RepID=A0A5J5EDT7_9PEZI|nr:hypothetical protein FN846DRAFT_979056 [Sphaerosporella brunnea]